MRNDVFVSCVSRHYFVVEVMPTLYMDWLYRLIGKAGQRAFFTQMGGAEVPVFIYGEKAPTHLRELELGCWQRVGRILSRYWRWWNLAKTGKLQQLLNFIL